MGAIRLDGHIDTAYKESLEASSNGRPQTKIKDLKTLAVVIDQPKADFKLTPIILDEVRPNEVLVEMRYSGLCKLTYPFLLEIRY